MSQDNQARIEVDANLSPLRQKLAQAGRDLQQFGGQASSSMQGALAPLEALQSKFLAVGAVLAGGAVFKAAVDATARLAEESIQLGRSMGVSATEAGSLRAAIDDVGATQEEFGAAAKGLTRNLRENEGALNAMGLKTRDAAGNLRPMKDLMLDAVGVVNQYADGADRNAAAQAVFGKSVDGTSKLLNLQADTVRENAALQESLGATVGQSMVENFRAYDSAMDKVAITMQAAQTAIGNALMPALTRLAEWFVSIGPAAITVVKGAIGGLVAAFWGIKNAVTIVWETINAMSASVAAPIAGVAEAIGRALEGDWKGARAAIAGVGTTISAAWGNAMDRMVESSAEARDKIWALFVDDGGPAAMAQGGTRRMAAKPEKPAAGKAEKPAKPDNEQALYARAIAQHRAYVAEYLSGEQQRAAGEIAIEQAAAQAAEANGEITKAQLLALEQQFEARKFEIARAALQERLTLLQADPNYNPIERQRLLNELGALEQQHQVRMTQLAGQMRAQGGFANLFDGVGNAFGNMLNGLINRTQTWGQALGGLLQGVGQQMIQTLAVQPLQAWIASGAQMLAAKLGFAAQSEAIDQTGAAVSTAINAESAMAKIGANAAVAGSGSAAALAGIPFAGPALAMAAMGAMVAAVMALTGGIKSAAGGYDIPSGINPMTQLHQEEMVLPAKYANTIRNLASAGGGAGQGGHSVTYNDHSGRLTREQIRANARLIADELNRVHRDGWRPA